MRSGDIRAQSKESISWSSRTETVSSSPVLETAADESYTNQHDSWTCDNGRKDLLDEARRHERDQDFGQGAASCRADDGAVSVWAGKLGAVCCSGTEAVGVHLLEGALSNGDDSK